MFKLAFILPIIFTFLGSISMMNPAFGNIVITNGLTHIHQVSAGNIYKGKIELQNTTDQLQSVKIYQRDYKFYYTGEAVYDPTNSHERSNAKWITISNSLLTLQPREKTVVNYEINVPEGINIDGTAWSVIMLEGLPNVSPEQVRSGLSINTVMRYAVQIATTIGNTGVAELKFLKVDLKKNNDFSNQLEVIIENTGDRLLIPTMSVELFDDNGNSIDTYSAKKKKTYPTTSVLYLIDLEEVPPGNYKAILLADCEEEEIFGMNLTLDLSNE